MLCKLPHARTWIQAKYPQPRRRIAHPSVMAILTFVMPLFFAPIARASPEIEAASFTATLDRISNTGRVLLFSSSGALPNEDQLVLLRDESGPAFAVRARKLYSDQRFAGQIVKTYDGKGAAAPGQTYTALMKVRDIAPPQNGAATPPEDLDKLLTESGKEEPKKATTISPDEELELKSLVIDQIDPYEQERSAIAFRSAVVRLPEFSAGFIFPVATGVRWSHTVAHPFWFPTGVTQDALGVDVTSLFTKLNDYTPTGGDSFLLLPLTVSARYTVYSSPIFGFYGYAGLGHTFILSASGEDPDYSDALALLPYTQVAMGAGITFEVGPQWWVQIEAGLDQVGANIALRF